MAARKRKKENRIYFMLSCTYVMREREKVALNILSRKSKRELMEHSVYSNNEEMIGPDLTCRIRRSPRKLSSQAADGIHWPIAICVV